MTPPQFITANLRDHRDEVLELNVEYLSWVFAEVDAFFGVSCTAIVGMSAADYVASVLEKVCDRTPPHGVFYLLQHEGKIAGMGGLRALSSEAAEIKRIYIRPGFRGARLGERMLQRLLEDARQFGYRRACLESAPFMKAAHRIYEAAGFHDRPPYLEAEVPVIFHDRWRFMECTLAQSNPA